MPLKILVVTGYDINETFAEILEAEDCVVECSEDDREALQRVREHSFDILIIGARIRGINGLEFLSQLRKEGLHHPVLFATAYPSLESATSALDLKVSAYMQLPCTFDDLRGAVQNIARRHKIPARAKDRHYIEIAEHVRAQRRAKGWSLAELAQHCEHAGLDVDTITRIESRTREPSPDQLRRLSSVLELELLPFPGSRTTVS